MEARQMSDDSFGAKPDASLLYLQAMESKMYAAPDLATRCETGWCIDECIDQCGLCGEVSGISGHGESSLDTSISAVQEASEQAAAVPAMGALAGTDAAPVFSPASLPAIAPSSFTGMGPQAQPSWSPGGTFVAQSPNMFLQHAHHWPWQPKLQTPAHALVPSTPPSFQHRLLLPQSPTVTSYVATQPTDFGLQQDTEPRNVSLHPVRQTTCPVPAKPSGTNLLGSLSTTATTYTSRQMSMDMSASVSSTRIASPVSMSASCRTASWYYPSTTRWVSADDSLLKTTPGQVYSTLSPGEHCSRIGSARKSSGVMGYSVDIPPAQTVSPLRSTYVRQPSLPVQTVVATEVGQTQSQNMWMEDMLVQWGASPILTNVGKSVVHMSAGDPSTQGSAVQPSPMVASRQLHTQIPGLVTQRVHYDMVEHGSLPSMDPHYQVASTLPHSTSPAEFDALQQEYSELTWWRQAAYSMDPELRALHQEHAELTLQLQQRRMERESQAASLQVSEELPRAVQPISNWSAVQVPSAISTVHIGDPEFVANRPMDLPGGHSQEAFHPIVVQTAEESPDVSAGVESPLLVAVTRDDPSAESLSARTQPTQPGALTCEAQDLSLMLAEDCVLNDMAEEATRVSAMQTLPLHEFDAEVTQPHEVSAEALDFDAAQTRDCLLEQAIACATERGGLSSDALSCTAMPPQCCLQASPGWPTSSISVVPSAVTASVTQPFYEGAYTSVVYHSGGRLAENIVHTAVPVPSTQATIYVPPPEARVHSVVSRSSPLLPAGSARLAGGRPQEIVSSVVLQPGRSQELPVSTVLQQASGSSSLSSSHEVLSPMTSPRNTMMSPRVPCLAQPGPPQERILVPRLAEPVGLISSIASPRLPDPTVIAAPVSPRLADAVGLVPPVGLFPCPQAGIF